MLQVLLDENMPHKLTQLFGENIEARTINQQGWNGIENGELLRVAQDEFNVFITIDQGIPHQQNLGLFSIGIVLIKASSNRFEDVKPLMKKVNKAVKNVSDGELEIVIKK